MQVLFPAILPLVVSSFLHHRLYFIVYKIINSLMLCIYSQFIVIIFTESIQLIFI